MYSARQLRRQHGKDGGLATASASQFPKRANCAVLSIGLGRRTLPGPRALADVVSCKMKRLPSASEPFRRQQSRSRGYYSQVPRTRRSLAERDPMDSERLPRRLAAILYGDVAGYSRATGVDEDGTHQTLSEYLDAVSAVVERHRGRVMHYAGDAVLATFAAAVDALRAATEIHSEVASRNSTLPAQRRIEFRLGVNLGDVIEDRGDVYGNGVNVAARLAALSAPGGICVSDSVRVAVGQRLPLDYRDIGTQRLKNIDEPVRAYRVAPGAAQNGLRLGGALVPRRRVVHVALAGLVVLAAGFGAVHWGETVLGAADRASKSVVPGADERSIAVLPFDNLGAEEDEYFSDGLTDELIVRLARVPGLEVAPHTSSFYFKRRNELPKTIAGELGADRLYVATQAVSRRAGTNWASRKP